MCFVAAAVVFNLGSNRINSVGKLGEQKSGLLSASGGLWYLGGTWAWGATPLKVGMWVWGPTPLKVGCGHREQPH